jgi:polysaccharide export outer membrane protein
VAAIIAFVLTSPVLADEKAPPLAAPPGQTKTLPLNYARTDYRIGPGDVLNISVWKDEALTQQLPVLPDGTLHFPLVGKLTAGGKTLDEFKRELEEKIERYVPEPVLSVSLTQINSMLVYVIGRVNAPGRFVINTHVNALQALAMAGGPNPFAKRNKIKIIREENDQTLIFDFPYDDITKGERLEYNILLKRGDVMVVP